MAISAAGIIFSNLNNNTLSRLTGDRTVAAIPFACRYRLIDFCLSNMVNANISNINIVANYNYRSLLEHIGSGKDWDLARRKGGINLISPYQTSHASTGEVFSTHLEALKSMKDYIEEFKEEYVVLMDSDNILNINLSEVIADHEKNDANITIVTKRINPDFSSKTPKVMISSSSGRVVDMVQGTTYNPQATELSLSIFVMKTTLLRKIISQANAYYLKSLTGILMNNYKTANYRTYCYDGYVASVTSFLDYYRCSIELATDCEARASLLWKKEAPVFTRVHNSAPAVYKNSAVVENSMIADECVIEGTVINSVLSRGVRVEKGAVVCNSVLFQGTSVGKNAELNCIVTDKNVKVSEGVKLSGNQNMPFYVQKDRMV